MFLRAKSRKNRRTLVAQAVEYLHKESNNPLVLLIHGSDEMCSILLAEMDAHHAMSKNYVLVRSRRLPLLATG